MQASEPASTSRPPLSRVYGLRLFYERRVRLGLAAAGALLAALYYLDQALGELAIIQHRPLEFDFGQFYRAAQDLSAGRNPYDVFVHLHCQSWCLGGYIYPPLLAELLRPLAGLTRPEAAAVWLVFCHLTVVASALLLWRILRGRVTTTTMLAMLATGLLFQPLYENLSYVQIGTLILLILTAAAALHLRGRASAGFGSGALVGLATVFKVTPVVMAPALLPVGWASGRLRDRGFREAAAGIAGVLVVSVGLVLVMLVTVPHTVDFFTQVLPHIGGGTTAYENKSLPAMVARAFELTGEVQPGLKITPDSKLVTVFAFVLVLGPTLVVAGGTQPRPGEDWTARAAAFSTYVAAMPIISTITWRHHMVVSILAMALLLPALWPAAGATSSRAARWLLVASYPLSFIPQDLAHRLALGSGIAHPTLLDAFRVLLIEDLNLFGMAFLWLAALLALRGLAGARPVSVADPSPAEKGDDRGLESDRSETWRSVDAG